MLAIKRTPEVVANENVGVGLGQDRLECMYLGDEAFCVDGRIFPVQPQLDGDLGNLADDADNTDNPEQVGHMYVSLRHFDEVARPVGGIRGS